MLGVFPTSKALASADHDEPDPAQRGDVDGQVGQQKHEANDEDHGDDGVDVRLGNRLDGVSANARPPENLLDEHGCRGARLGIEAVVLKGSALAWSVWPSPAERVMRDIDQDTYTVTVGNDDNCTGIITIIRR